MKKRIDRLEARNCKTCNEGFVGHFRRKYCDSCTAKKTERKSNLCICCGADISSFHPNKRRCNSCTESGEVRRMYAANTIGKNDNEIARQVTKFAVRAGFLLPPENFKCAHCNYRQAECYDHRDYNKPLDVEPVCCRCNSSRGRGIQFFSPHRSLTVTKSA